MSVEKFNAAVHLIKSLPKSGTYQPSNELMLKFYGFYKQATEGPCTTLKPNFWDVVNRAKWESWKSLGNMSKEEAMKAYVAELQKIVETMSYNKEVQEFMNVNDDAQVLFQQENSTTSAQRTPESDDEFIDTIENDPEPAKTEASSTAHITMEMYNHLMETLDRLENATSELKKTIDRKDTDRQIRKRWPWQELSMSTLLFMVIWPMVAIKIMSPSRNK